MEGDVGIDENAAIATENGLRTTNGLRVTNGLTGVSTNGLSLAYGLSTSAGLSATSGLMTTTEGRDQVAYLVRCALPVNTSITKGSYTFQGLMGMAPEWQNGACGTTCQENVSACMLAHVNTAGLHIPLWLVAGNTAVGWGQDPDFPNQEAAFFGNIFTAGAHGTDPATTAAFFCTGAKYNVSPPDGRVGGTQTNAPYTNPFGTTYAACSTNYRCASADYPSQGDGFKACNGWNNVVTVWRQIAATATSPSGGVGKGYRWK